MDASTRLTVRAALKVREARQHAEHARRLAEDMPDDDAVGALLWATAFDLWADIAEAMLARRAVTMTQLYLPGTHPPDAG